MKHNLKILPCYYHAVLRGDKNFEIRDNSDRGFQADDEVKLLEWSKESGYTGSSVDVVITYVTNFEQKPNFVVFGFKPRWSENKIGGLIDEMV